MKIFITIFFLIFSGLALAQSNKDWGEQRNGTYNNPIIPGDFSDIDAIRVGDDFYAISSTLHLSPGMVVLHSKDLVNWEIISHVVSDLTEISPELNWDKLNRYGKGIWAGSIRYYNGRFWVYFGTPNHGFFMSSAESPKGPWDRLHHLWDVPGWDDCCSFLDDDGKLYFIATNFALDPKNNKKYNIHLFQMTPDGKQLMFETDSIIYQARGSEANKLYKINGLYYHYFSEVNSEGRVIMMGRSKNIYGPYEIKQINHVNKSKDREPNQGGIIQLESGDWWFLTHHGSSGFWEGRTVSLLPVNWVDNWPLIGAVGADKIGNMVWSATMPLKAHPEISIKTNDEFNESEIANHWEWNHQPNANKWSLTEQPGYLRIYASKPVTTQNRRSQFFNIPNVISQRSFRTDKIEATAKFEIANMTDGQFAGICHFGKTYSTFGIQQKNDQKKIVLNNNEFKSIGETISTPTIYLKSTWGTDGQSYYSYSTDGKNFQSFGEKYQLTWGDYRGDRIGICTYNKERETGYIEVDWFHFIF